MVEEKQYSDRTLCSMYILIKAYMTIIVIFYILLAGIRRPRKGLLLIIYKIKRKLTDIFVFSIIKLCATMRKTVNS